ncbi:MAG: hypothetical protein V4617_07950 [Gemmatimonadota bacterium]
MAADSAALFQTDATTYTFATTEAGTQVRLRATFTNRSGRTIYFVNCHGGTSLTVQRLDGATWTDFWSPELPACLSAPITVASDGTHTFEIGVFAEKPGDNYYPKFAGPLTTGLYRVMWHNAYFTYQDRLPWGVPVPESQRVSNSFEINAP